MTSRHATVASSTSPSRRGPSRLTALLLIAVIVVIVVLAPKLVRSGGDAPAPTAHAVTPLASRGTAVRAAVDALYALTVPAITDRARFDTVARRLAAPGAAEHVRAVFGKTDPRVIAAFREQPSVLRGAPLGYRVDQYDGRTASIAIWNVALASAPGEPARSQWRTLVVDLAWTAQGWRVTHGAGVNGPDPSTPRDELAAAAAGFRSFRYVP